MSLNMNSPIVQAMLANTPNGFGNMPVYYGNTPTITTETVPVQSQSPSQSFPSPKEMLSANGQQYIYGQTSFTPQPMNQYVGGIPNFNPVFNGYSNPYMGMGTFMGYWKDPNEVIPIDEESRNILEAAKFNGVTYGEQLINTSNLNKQLSRVVSRCLGRSEEETASREKYYDIYYKFQTNEEISRTIDLMNKEFEEKRKKLHVVIKRGDEIIADYGTEVTPAIVSTGFKNYATAGQYFSIKKDEWHRIKENALARFSYLYNTAVERKYDNASLYEFFNGGVGYDILHSGFEEAQRRNAYKRASMIYDKNSLHNMLRSAAGKKPIEEQRAMDRFIGRYGIMPDGRPVSPTHDPRVAESFSYNPATGEFNITAPNFISERINRARESFKRSIDEDITPIIGGDNNG